MVDVYSSFSTFHSAIRKHFAEDKCRREYSVRVNDLHYPRLEHYSVMDGG
jgi:hypothetical protein